MGKLFSKNMRQFIKLHKQFLSFISSIKDLPTSIHERKLLNLILQNFEEIASCGTAGGKRAKLINELIQKKGNSTSEKLAQIEYQGKTAQSPIIDHLISLEIEKFRGFNEKCQFNLEKQYNLVYGPNGSGKSSLCESIEYVLLGFINEAETKRIPLDDYIKNLYINISKIPVLKGVSEDGELVRITPDYDQYNFCIIEKCRIDTFARISAHTPSNQDQLLSSIFGLDEFSEFVKNFTEDIERYITPTESLKQKEYDERASAVKTHKQNILQYKQELSSLEEQKAKIINRSSLGTTFAEVDAYLNGNVYSGGRLKNIEEELQSYASQKIEFKKTAVLYTNIKSLRGSIDQFTKTQNEFEQKSNEINLTDLYKTVLYFENIYPDKCPVCETPIKTSSLTSSVSKNPYENAKKNLLQLKAIASIQKNRDSIWDKLILEKNEFLENLQTFIKAVKLLPKEIGLVLPGELKNQQIKIADQSIIIPKLLKFLNEFELKKEIIATCEIELDQRNSNYSERDEIRRLLLQEKELLIALNIEIQKIKTTEATFRNLLSKAQQETELFDMANATLLKGIEIEKNIIAENKLYIAAYKSFKQKLVTYKEMLPLQLVVDLNGLIKEFYNSINMDDQKFELIHTVKLPVKSNEGIQVSFQDSPSKFVNVLLVLSEGHIKCLGLAILLAKCIHSGSKFLIFDDVVNAIDDDHRGRIRDLILTNDHFKLKQFIITSHSEEFIKDFENSFAREDYDRSVNKIVLLPRSAKRIQKAEYIAHYLQNAHIFYAVNNKRDCLANCRRALENIADVLWKKLIKYKNGKYKIEIKVILLSPNKKPDLLNLLSSLRVCIQKIDDQFLKDIQKIISWFEGLQSTHSRIWEFLNKGTHEEGERDDFDPVLVKNILDNSVLLETKVKDKWESDGN
jgi:energy-coupling factor transporter ATP-binding protein EcfA2